MKKIGDLTVNDGKGLFDNVGLCDSIITDLNNLIKNAVAGQYIKCSAIVVTITKKLLNLKDGIETDLKSKDQIIEELKRINDGLVEQLTGLPVDKEGDNLGSD